MKQPLLATALVAGTVGALSAGLVSVLVGPDAHEARPTDSEVARARAAAPLGAGAVDERLAVLLDSLAGEQRELRARLEALERRPEPAERVAIAPTAVLTDGRAPAARAAEAAALPPGDVHASVARALEDIRAEERAAAQRLAEQRELERMEERLTRMSEQLGLTASQSADMRALMLEAQRTRAELERQREAGATRDAQRDARDEARKREELALSRILTPQQLETYQRRYAQRENDARRDRRPGGDNARRRG